MIISSFHLKGFLKVRTDGDLERMAKIEEYIPRYIQNACNRNKRTASRTDSTEDSTEERAEELLSIIQHNHQSKEKQN